MEGYNFQCGQFKIITDVWLCGPSEKDQYGKKFDGAYPSGFLKRLKSAFKECYPSDPSKILHVCSGRIPKSEGIRLDIDPKYQPDYIASAENIPIPDNTFDWVIADPPYNHEASMKYYNKPLLSKSKMIKEMVRVCKSGGFVGLLDQIMINKPPINSKRFAMIGVTSVPNLDMRIFTVLRKI